jgi:hypothetical protein
MWLVLGFPVCRCSHSPYPFSLIPSPLQPADRGLLPTPALLAAAQASLVNSKMTDPVAKDCLLTPANCTANVAIGGFGSLIWRLVGNMRLAADGECGVTGFGATDGCPNRPKVGLQTDSCTRP